MNKYIFLSLAIVFSVILVSCKEDSKDAPSVYDGAKDANHNYNYFPIPYIVFETSVSSFNYYMLNHEYSVVDTTEVDTEGGKLTYLRGLHKAAGDNEKDVSYLATFVNEKYALLEVFLKYDEATLNAVNTDFEARYDKKDDGAYLTIDGKVKIVVEKKEAANTLFSDETQEYVVVTYSLP